MGTLLCFLFVVIRKAYSNQNGNTLKQILFWRTLSKAARQQSGRAALLSARQKVLVLKYFRLN